MDAGHVFQCDHRPAMVLLSYTISVLGAFCALQWAGQIRQAKGWLLGSWVAGAAVAMGGGAIWSMHFIAMMACRLPVPVRYDLTLTIASLLVAVAVTGVGLYTVGVGATSTVRLLAGGVFTGLGVAAMHYTGMAAMRLPARTVYRADLVAASVGIAIFAATAALWIAFNMRSRVQRGLSSLVMGVAVCGMHYTAMAAATFVPDASISGSAGSALKSDELGYMVFAVTLFVLVLLSLGSRIIERTQVEEVLRRAHDDLERQVAERTADVERERAFLRQVIDTSPDFIFAKDREGRFTLVNKAVADAYGTTVDALVGRKDADFNPNADEVAFFLAADRAVMDSRREMRIPEEKITDAAGRVLWLQTVKRPIVGRDGTAHQVLGVSTDITQRKTLEEQLRQSQKMEAIGTLAGGVAHDFNNFLTMILGYSDVLLGAIEPGNPLRDHADEIRKAGERGASLTRQLLAFSRKELVEPKILELDAIVADMERMLRRLLGASIELATIAPAGLGRIRADRGQMDQVVMNLVVNARDAMPRGGKLSIRSANVELTESDTRDDFPLEPGRYVMLEVSDTGTGIDPAVRGRIFEPFFTTKERGKGTGLGLSTVWGIVKQNGGTVRVESEGGRGTTFRIYFPRVDDAVALESGDWPAAIAGTETILVVEDEASIRKLAAMALAANGYRVLEATNGEEAMRVAAGADAIDLILTDGVMPGIGVGDMLSTLRTARPHAKMLLMSGYTGEAFVRRGVLEAEMPFLAKPFTSSVLLRKVRDVLDAR